MRMDKKTKRADTSLDNFKNPLNKDKMMEEVHRVAFEIYEKSGRTQGHDLDNWLKAEKIVINSRK